jgi:hypothetical protein
MIGIDSGRAPGPTQFYLMDMGQIVEFTTHLHSPHLRLHGVVLNRTQREFYFTCKEPMLLHIALELQVSFFSIILGNVLCLPVILSFS